MKNKLNLSLKMTNWCNMNCAHCCERSDCKQPVNLAPLKTIESNIHELINLPVPKHEIFIIGGGEPMAPYFHNDNEYIRKTSSFVMDNKFIPAFKTNGLWGKTFNLRSRILKDIAKVSYNYDILTNLDFSIDEYHNNVLEIANIMSDIITSKYLNPSIIITLTGFKTLASISQLFRLKYILDERDIKLENMTTAECDMYYDNDGARIMLSFESTVFAEGRALDNNLSQVKPEDESDEYGHCLQIDNNNIVKLDSLWKMPVNGNLKSVVMELFDKQKYKQ